MVYNPVIIFLTLQGDGMVGKITRRLTGGKNTVSLILTVGKKQKKIQQLSRKKKPSGSGLTKIKGSGQRWRKKP